METGQQALDANIISELKGLMGADFPVLVKTFVKDSEQRIEAITAAVAERDGEGLRRAAHSFKGSSANLGAVGLSELCRQLEECGRDGDLIGASGRLGSLRDEFARVRQQLSAIG